MHLCVCANQSVYARDREEEILCHHQTWKTSCPFVSGQKTGSSAWPLYIFLYIMCVFVCGCVCACMLVSGRA